MTDADLKILSRAANLRDIGGISTSSGRQVRSGVVFRSALLDARDEALVARVGALGIRTIVDLRGNNERAAWPTPWEAVGCTDYRYHDHDHDAGNLLRMASEFPDDAPVRVRNEMLRLYRVLPFAQRHNYRAVFESIAAGRLPVLFHCAAGKDRTGVLAALILLAVDVPMESVIEDYLRTNAFDLEAAWLARGESRGAMRIALAPLLLADAAYLEAMFEDLMARHGSIDGYMANVLDMDDGARKQFRVALTGPA